jgi:hypothetical protein
MHLDQLVFILLVAVAFLFQLLTRAAKASKGPGETRPRSTPPPIPYAPAESDEERIRRFLEALGQPTTSKPPPPVVPRPAYQKPNVLPHLPPLGSPLPPLTTCPPELVQESKRATEILPTREKRTIRPKVVDAPAFDVHKGPMLTEPPPIIKTPAEAYAIATQTISKPKEPGIDITAMLRSASGLRDAIVLREIFGPPRSLQPLDFIGSV